MKLNSNNYFSFENETKYMGVSQFKRYAGTIGQGGCEAMARACINGDGEWGKEKSTALLVGSYVDAYFEGSLDVFVAENPEIFNTRIYENENTIQKLYDTGEGYVTRNNTLVANRVKEAKEKYPDFFTVEHTLKADFKRADYIIERIKRDPLFMKYLSGEKQLIMTGNLFDVDWKIKIDSYIPNVAIVDLKVMDSLTKTYWVSDIGKISWVEYWGYDIQAAVYQEIVYMNIGKRLPFYFAAASKEPEPDIEIIGIDQKTLDNALERVRTALPRVIAVKNGEVEPDRCEKCDFCKFTKILTKPLHFADLMVG